MKELWQLFFSFGKIGALTFGGGLSMLPMLQRELVEQKGWVTEEELLNYYAIGQCTPGIIAVNTATFVGYRKKGIGGGIAATLGVIFPSFVIISILALFLSSFASYPVVQHMFAGIRVAVVALILQAVVKLAKGSIQNKLGLILAGVTFAVLLVLDLSPILTVFLAIFGGILYGNITRKKGGKA